MNTNLYTIRSKLNYERPTSTYRRDTSNYPAAALVRTRHAWHCLAAWTFLWRWRASIIY